MLKLQILLISDSIQRDLPGLKYLAKELSRKLNARVSIIGSIAEMQRMYYLAYRLKPDIVFISQIQENANREFARYLRNSGAVVCILPAELTYSSQNLFWIFNQKLSYDDLVDLYFLPGIQMFQDLKKYSDIQNQKLIVTGTPRIDASIVELKQYLSRHQFSHKYSIPEKKKNLFVYTTFFASSLEYLKTEEAFKGNVKAVNRIYQSIHDTKKYFLRDISKLCQDFPDVNIILKPHPLEDFSDYQKINYPNFYLITGELFANTINSIDLALHWNSTVATECWVFGKKTIQYSPVARYKNILSNFYPGNPLLEKYEDLKFSVEKYLKEKLGNSYTIYQRKYLKQWYYRVDGQSAQRITNRLSKYLKNKDMTTQYLPRYDKKYIMLDLLEKIVGVEGSRRLISLSLPGFKWEYAVKNYVSIINQNG